MIDKNIGHFKNGRYQISSKLAKESVFTRVETLDPRSLPPDESIRNQLGNLGECKRQVSHPRHKKNTDKVDVISSITTKAP